MLRDVWRAMNAGRGMLSRAAPEPRRQIMTADQARRFAREWTDGLATVNA
jgi:hypothetical protein